MHRYLITRTVPGAGKLSAAELQAMSAKSNEVVAELAPDAQWVHSYVIDDMIYCVYNAKDAETLRVHARLSGFPLDHVTLIHSVLDPISGEA